MVLCLLLPADVEPELYREAVRLEAQALLQRKRKELAGPTDRQKSAKLSRPSAGDSSPPISPEERQNEDTGGGLNSSPGRASSESNAEEEEKNGAVCATD